MLPPHEPSPQPPPATSEVPGDRLRLVKDIATQSWRVAALITRALAAALLPVRFQDLPHVIAAYLRHIARRHENKRPTAIARFLERAMVLARAGPARAAAAEVSA